MLRNKSATQHRDRERGERQTDRQRQRKRETEKQTDRQTDRQAGRQTDREISILQGEKVVDAGFPFLAHGLMLCYKGNMHNYL